MKSALFLVCIAIALAASTSCTPSNNGESTTSSDGYFGPAPTSPVEQTTRFHSGLSDYTRSSVR